MIVYRCFEKRDWGSGKATWRPVPATSRKGAALAYAMRRVSNKEVEKFW